MGPDRPQLSPRIATTTRSITPTLDRKFAGAFAGLAAVPPPLAVAAGRSDEPAGRLSIRVPET